MSKAYTGKGDNGYTKTFDGRAVPKDSLIIVAQGKIDALLSSLDLAKCLNPPYLQRLEGIQTKLWQMGGELSGYGQAVKKEDILGLEKLIDECGKPPTQFVRFSKQSSISLDRCRISCREAEIALTPLHRSQEISNDFYVYMNRLSSYFFMLAYTAEKEL